MVALRNFLDELRERAVRLVREVKAEPGASGKGACRRVGERLLNHGHTREVFHGHER